MRKWFISVLCWMMIVFNGCGLNPDSILHNEESVLKTDSEMEEVIIESEENKTESEEGRIEAKEDENISSESGTQKKGQIFVYICGAVKVPGVYALDRDSRIFQLVEKAGGLTEDADEQSVNLAELVEDGQMVRILTIEERESGLATLAEYSDAGSDSGISGDGKVNINKATLEELTSLNGIGEAKAASIIAYRESHGSFQSIEEIMQVDGIAQGTYDKIKENIII